LNKDVIGLILLAVCFFLGRYFCGWFHVGSPFIFNQLYL